MDLDAVARAAAKDAGGLDPALLGEFLSTVVAATGTGRTLRPEELEAYGRQGAVAAAQGVALRALIDLYLSASWRLWDELDVVRHGTAAQVRAAGLAVLRAADDGVAAVAEGYQVARSDLTRRRDVERREVFEALLQGGRAAEDAFGLARDLGLDLASPHAVLVAADVELLRGSAAAAVLGRVERALAGRYADAPPLVSVQHGQLVCVFAAPGPRAVQEVSERVARVLADEQPAAGAGTLWQLTVGRAVAGPTGVRASYEHARDTLDLAVRLGLSAPVVQSEDLSVYRVLLRDRPAMVELIATTLGPLAGVRGAAGLLETLEVFYATGANATETGRRLHLSVRAVSYRLTRVAAALGRDPADPAQRLALHAAVVGARLLDWPGVTLEQ